LSINPTGAPLVTPTTPKRPDRYERTSGPIDRPRATNPVGGGLLALRAGGAVSPSSPEGMVASVVKATLANKTDADAQAMMKSHFMQLKLLDADGNWAHPKLAAIGDQLMPKVTVADLEGLIDEMAKNAADNPYLHDFLKTAQGKEFKELYRNVRASGDDVLPGVAAYAMVLQNITVAQRDDFEVLAACHEVWSKAREDLDSSKHFGMFERVKLASVEKPIRMIIDAHESGEVDPKMFRLLLPLNIMEAVAVDAVNGRWGNAKTGWVLATHPPGSSTNDATGAGPAQFGEDGKGIELNMPLAKEWADLYSAWNLGFVSHYSYFPYVFAKLLIPEVNDYEDTPAEYIYDRAMALYTHLNFSLFGRAYGPISVDSFDWSSEKLTRLFGEVNAKSAADYEAKVDELDPGPLKIIGDKAKSIFSLFSGE